MRSKAQHMRSRSGLLRLRYVPQHAQHTPLGVLRCCALPTHSCSMLHHRIKVGEKSGAPGMTGDSALVP